MNPQSIEEAKALRLIALKNHNKAKKIGNTQMIGASSKALTSATSALMRLELDRDRASLRSKLAAWGRVLKGWS